MRKTPDPSLGYLRLMASLRPYTTYKAFGGMFAAFWLPGLILLVLDVVPTQGSLPLLGGLLLGGLGLLGLSIFVLSDRALTKLQEQQAAEDPPSEAEQKPSTVDWRGMAIAALLMLAYLSAVVVAPIVLR